MSSPFTSRLRRYWPVGTVLLAGLALSSGTGWMLHDDAVELDEARFAIEANMVATMLEQTMERYEERLARLADYCGQFEEMPRGVWSFRSQATTDIGGNLPCVIHALYCPKVMATNFQAHYERGKQVSGERYRFDPQERPGRSYALPVWQAYTRAGFKPIPVGTDLVEETDLHPSIGVSLAYGRGWVSPQPASVPRTDGSVENGFWFAVTLFAPDQPNMSPISLPGETSQQFARRHAAFKREVARGTLAVFISADHMVDRGHNLRNAPRVGEKMDNPAKTNEANTTARLHGRLYASREPSPASLLNRLSQAPANPRHRRVIVQPWYGRKWALELTSTPLFEADSRRLRGRLALAGGSGITFLAAALMGVSLRARNRQEQMTADVIEARDALAAAEKEREKLGHDIHDGAIQSLYAVQLGLTRTAENVAESVPSAARVLEETRMRLDEVIAELRRFILAREAAKDIAPPPGLESVLASMVERLQPTTATELEFSAEPGAADDLSVAQVVQLTQIARTAVGNSLRHAQARKVEISLQRAHDNGEPPKGGTPNMVRLEIADDGIGFDLDRPTNGGMGLRTMRTRAMEAGGTISVDSRPGSGTRIVVAIPIPIRPSINEDWRMRTRPGTGVKGQE